MRNSLKIAVIGLGYVGLPLALELAKKFNVVGYDINNSRIKSLKLKKDSNQEFKFVNNTNIHFTSNNSDLSDSQIYIIAVPTPINNKKKPDISLLKQASKTIGKYLKKNDIVIIESTVYPGCTRNDCIPIIANISKLRPNIDFFFGYSPERINPGDRIHTISSIKKVISASNESTLKKLKYMYGSIIKAGVHIAPTIEIAEAAKVIENTQRDLNIAFVNELSIIFEKMKIPTKSVLEAASTKWNFLNFRPGLVGGHCIGVDPYYLSYASQKKGYKPIFMTSGRKINNDMPTYIFNKIIRNLKKFELSLNSKALVLGLTFKENVSDLRNSKIFEIIDKLDQKLKKVEIFDPLIKKNQLDKKYQKNFIDKKNINLKTYEVIIFAVAHEKLIKAYERKIYSSYSKKRMLVDLSMSLKKEYVDISY